MAPVFTATVPRGYSLTRAANRRSAASNSLLAGESAQHTLEERCIVAALGRRMPRLRRHRLLEARGARPGERQRRLVLVGVEHDLVPQAGRERAAGDLPHA